MLDKQARWQMVLDTAARKAGWGHAPSGHHQGIAAMSGYDTYLAQVAEVSVQGNQLKVHRIVCAIDCGQMVNPGIVQAQAEGSIMFGLTAALFSEINIANGRVKEQNFDDYRMLRMQRDAADRGVRRRQHREARRHGRAGDRTGAPAVCNAIYAATQRSGSVALPIAKQGCNHGAWKFSGARLFSSSARRRVHLRCCSPR